jgi:N-acetylmuramic acid 6-phosphate etherase
MAAERDNSDPGAPEQAFLSQLLASQKRAVESVAVAAQSIERAAQAIGAKLGAGGRLVYIGAGSSGLIALQDGAELPGTFGLDPRRILYVIAGGLESIADIDAEAEDDRAAAVADVKALGAMSGDVAIAVSASGSTPYTLSAAEAARQAGALLVSIANRAGAPLLALADHPILLESGPEALHGSTRLAAGTAQKCALGMLSTLANAGLGHVYRGHMVNLRPENDKLRKRAVHIVASVAGVDEELASASLGRARGDVKCAIVLASADVEPERASAMIAQAGGHVGAALTRLRAKASNF